MRHWGYIAPPNYSGMWDDMTLYPTAGQEYNAILDGFGVGTLWQGQFAGTDARGHDQYVWGYGTSSGGDFTPAYGEIDRVNGHFLEAAGFPAAAPSNSGSRNAANSGMNPLQRQVQAMIDSGVLPSLAADAGAGALGPKKVTVEGLRTVITNSLKQMDELTKNRYGFYSIDAVNLLLGTAIQESGGLRWRVQVNGGPARGLFQMEEATYTDIWNNFLNIAHNWRTH